MGHNVRSKVTSLCLSYLPSIEVRKHLGRLRFSSIKWIVVDKELKTSQSDVDSKWKGPKVQVNLLRNCDD